MKTYLEIAFKISQTNTHILQNFAITFHTFFQLPASSRGCQSKQLKIHTSQEI